MTQQSNVLSQCSPDEMHTPRTTGQDIFNRVHTHLLKQNKQSRDEDGTCAYHAENGLMCAVGVLIPSDRYTESLEGASVAHPVQHNPEDLADMLIALGLAEHTLLLQALQHVHDFYTPVDWTEKLAEVAEAFDLNVPGPTAEVAG